MRGRPRTRIHFGRGYFEVSQRLASCPKVILLIMLAFSPKGFVSFSKEKAFPFKVIPWQEPNLKAHEMRVLFWPELPVLFWAACFICSGEDLPYSFPAPTKQILMESLTGFRSSALFLPAIKSNLLGLWLCQICQGGKCAPRAQRRGKVAIFDLRAN